MPPTRLPEPFEIKRSDEMIKEDKKIYEAEKKQEAEQLSMFDTPLMSEKAKADYRDYSTSFLRRTGLLNMKISFI